MSDDRRYNQRGYQEGDQRASRPSQGFSPEGKRVPVITAYKETVRCAECGQDLSTAFDIQMESLCPKCNADLHTCRNCKHFDSAARFQCSQTIKERIGKKAAANQLPALHRAHDRRQGTGAGLERADRRRPARSLLAARRRGARRARASLQEIGR